MASFKNLIFITLFVYAVVAEESQPANDGEKVKRHAYIAAAPAPILSYSASVPAAYPYSYPAYPGYPAATYPASTYPAVTAYSAPAYASYPAGYVAYPKYANDDGSYWPGKYEKTFYPAYKTGYPVAYHY